MKSARPLERAWWGTDLGDYRGCSGTYERYRADSVPPVPPLDGSFSFLAPTGAADPFESAAVRELQLSAALPAPFVRFMGDPALREQVPSCTACEWDLSDALQPSRLVEAKHTVLFLRDQQDCLFWYLLIGGEQDGTVLCSPIPFDDPALDVDVDTVYAHSVLVAPSFEAFVWRFWMENVLWDLVNAKDAELDDAQRRYLEHYRS